MPPRIFLNRLSDFGSRDSRVHLSNRTKPVVIPSNIKKKELKRWENTKGWKKSQKDKWKVKLLLCPNFQDESCPTMKFWVPVVSSEVQYPGVHWAANVQIYLKTICAVWLFWMRSCYFWNELEMKRDCQGLAINISDFWQHRCTSGRIDERKNALSIVNLVETLSREVIFAKVSHFLPFWVTFGAPVFLSCYILANHSDFILLLQLGLPCTAFCRVWDVCTSVLEDSTAA